MKRRITNLYSQLTRAVSFRNLCRCMFHIDLTQRLANHLVGRHHTHWHRKTIGAVFILIGVVIAKSAHYFPHFLANIILDGVGYGLHGLGLIPFISAIEERKNTERNETPSVNQNPES